MGGGDNGGGDVVGGLGDSGVERHGIGWDEVAYDLNPDFLRLLRL